MKKGTETKERIKEKALSLFHERGYNLTSMNDIVAETGVKKGNLYFHYSSKEELAVEVLREALKDYEDFIASRMKGESSLSDIISMIRAIAEYHIDYGNGCGCIFGNMALESSGHNPALSHFIKSVFEGWEHNMSRLINASSKSGEIKPVESAELYARAIISQIEGAVMLSRVYSDFSHLKSITELIISELKGWSLDNDN